MPHNFAHGTADDDLGAQGGERHRLSVPILGIEFKTTPTGSAAAPVANGAARCRSSHASWPKNRSTPQKDVRSRTGIVCLVHYTPEGRCSCLLPTPCICPQRTTA